MGWRGASGLVGPLLFGDGFGDAGESGVGNEHLAEVVAGRCLSEEQSPLEASLARRAVALGLACSERHPLAQEELTHVLPRQAARVHDGLYCGADCR